MTGKDVQTGIGLLVGNIENMVHFYRDILGFQTQWDGGAFADFKTASGELSLFMYSGEEFVKAIGEDGVQEKIKIRPCLKNDKTPNNGAFCY